MGLGKRVKLAIVGSKKIKYNTILGFDVSISWALTKHSACMGYLL